MIADLKPYAEYKESGLPWLGQVPRHWEVTPLARLARLKSVVNQTQRQLLSVYLQRGVVRFSDIDEKRTNVTSEDLSNYQAVDPGDFVLNNQQAWRGSVGVSEHSGIVSPAYLVLSLSASLSSRYANLLFRDQSMVSQYLVCSKGVGTIQRNLYWPHLKRVGVIIPPPEEQAAIVRFLAWANWRLERAIRAKQEVIALLNEQKQAIIQRAVTQGLNPSVPQNPSAIPWLGNFPAHWRTVPIKRLLCRIDYGTSEAIRESGSIRILTMGNIQRGEVILPRSGGLDRLPDSMLLQHHDLLFTRTNGNPDLVGKVGLFRGHLSDRVSFASYLVRLRVKAPNDPQWLHMVLNSSAFWPFARSHALVNLQTNLNSTRYGQFPIPVPPPIEQAQIVEWVLGESKGLSSSIARLERQIELVREYRPRLVADVVTGKLDVREAAAKLPVDSEPATADDIPDDVEDIEVENGTDEA